MIKVFVLIAYYKNLLKCYYLKRNRKFLLFFNIFLNYSLNSLMSIRLELSTSNREAARLETF